MSETVTKKKKKTPEKRIEFLAKRFQVFDQEDMDLIFSEGKIDDDGLEVMTVYDIADTGENILNAMYTLNHNKTNDAGFNLISSVRVYEEAFINVVQADPTEHKEYVQWMLTTFVRFIKNNDFASAIRFINEDLWLASEYLEIFHAERHKAKFKTICAGNKAFMEIKDPSNINQYRDLSQLFDAVDPYIMKNPSKLEKDIRISARVGDGVIEYEDRKVLVFIPKTIKASRLFAKYTNWCTTTSKPQFESYPNQLTSKKTKSKLYIIMPKTFLLKEEDENRTKELYQLHFESGQHMDRSDRSITDMNSLIKGNVGLSDYFYDLLLDFARSNHKNYQHNKYVTALKKFRFVDIIFEVMPPDVEKIQMNGENLGDMPKIGKFKKLTSLFLLNCTCTLHPSIGELKSLGYLSLPNNGLKRLPSSIGRLKNLTVINVNGNNIEHIPESIKYLDKSNGGNLSYFSYGKGQLSDELVQNLKEWLPNATVNEFKGILNG
jgi:hypothetical protein